MRASAHEFTHDPLLPRIVAFAIPCTLAALIRSPKVLLCDEATSALDSQSERIVTEALDKALATSAGTAITIAHRLATVRHADTIVVLERGRVVEQGTHEELVSREGGLYRSLALAQDAAPEAAPHDAAAAALVGGAEEGGAAAADEEPTAAAAAATGSA